MGIFFNIAKQIYDKSVETKLEKLGQLIVDDIKESISTMSPPPSAPGQPPHMVTGGLYSGISYSIVGGELNIISTHPTVPELPSWLEYGTSKMAARPYMLPAALRVPELMQRAFEE